MNSLQSRAFLYAIPALKICGRPWRFLRSGGYRICCLSRSPGELRRDIGRRERNRAALPAVGSIVSVSYVEVSVQVRVFKCECQGELMK